MVTIQISKGCIIKLFIFFLYLPPVMLERINSKIGVCFDIATIGITMICLLDFYINNRTIEAFDVVLFLFILYGFLVTIIMSPRRLYEYMTLYFVPIVSGFFISTYLVKHDYLESIKMGGIYYSILIILNAVLMVIFPDGVFVSRVGSAVARANWMFGSKNNIVQHIPLIMLFICLVLEHSEFKLWWRLTICFFIAEIMSMGSNGIEFLGGSTTAILEIVIIVFAYFSKKNRIIYRFLDFMTFGKQILFVIVISAYIVWISIFHSTNVFINSALSFVGKDISFSFRDIVWSIELNNILKYPIIGSGMLYNFYTYSFVGSILMRFGIVGLTLMILLFIVNENSSISNNNKMVRIAIMGFLVSGIVNEISFKDFIVVLTISKYCGEFVFDVDRRISQEARDGG